MFIDNFAPRGTYTTYANQQKVPHWSTFIDTFMALEHVSKDPKINISKVGITGWSRGGAISIMASEKKLRDALIDKNLFFAAAQPRSPPCWSIGMFKNPTPTPETNTWMVLGGADDYTAAEPCVELGKKIKANEAIYTFVAVDSSGKPTKIDKINPETEEEKMRYDAALRRRQLSLVLAGKMKADDATELKALFS